MRGRAVKNRKDKEIGERQLLQQSRNKDKGNRHTIATAAAWMEMRRGKCVLGVREEKNSFSRIESSLDEEDGQDRPPFSSSGSSLEGVTSDGAGSGMRGASTIFSSLQ